MKRNGGEPIHYSGPGFVLSFTADDRGRKALQTALELLEVSRHHAALHAPLDPLLLSIDPVVILENAGSLEGVGSSFGGPSHG